jgi:hypothetical protein
LVLVATVAAIIDGKVVNLLIGAAMVASSLAGFAVLMERRLGDAYDTGSKATLRAAVQDLVAARGSDHGGSN